MDPPVSDDEESVEGSQLLSSREESEVLEERMEDLRVVQEDLVETQEMMRSHDQDEIDQEDNGIKDEEIKTLVPLYTSVMLTNVDHNVGEILAKLSCNKEEKVTIRFQPIGAVEQIQPKIFKISASQQFLTLVKFLNKKLSRNLAKNSVNRLFNGHIFCYLHNSFTPGPEEIIGNLFEVSIFGKRSDGGNY